MSIELLGKKVPTPGEMSTTIGAEAYFHGVITVRGSLYIEGQVEGDIHEAQMVVIGRNGCVKGDVCAQHVVVSGTIEGDVNAAQEFELKSGGRVTGDVHTKKLHIEEGAVFEGNCSMRDGAAEPQDRQEAEPAKKRKGGSAPPDSRQEEEPLRS